MSLISTISAPSAQPVRPTITAVNTSDIPAAHTPAVIKENLPVWPVSPPASSEAIVKEHRNPETTPKPSMADDAEAANHAAELAGVELDGIPYLRDGAILLDDLPQAAEPQPEKPKVEMPTEGSAAAVVAMKAETEQVQASDAARAEAAEQAYADERAIAALHKPEPRVKSEPAAAPATAQAEPDAHSPALEWEDV